MAFTKRDLEVLWNALREYDPDFFRHSITEFDAISQKLVEMYQDEEVSKDIAHSHQ